MEVEKEGKKDEQSEGSEESSQVEGMEVEGEGEGEEVAKTKSQKLTPKPREIFKVSLGLFDQKKCILLRKSGPAQKTSKGITRAKTKKDYRLRNGMLTITSLGSLESSTPNFATEDLLFPLGFHAHRLFWSYKNVQDVEEEDGARRSDICEKLYDIYKQKKAEVTDQSESESW